jgi:hypothetical protein
MELLQTDMRNTKLSAHAPAVQVMPTAQTWVMLPNFQWSASM